LDDYDYDLSLALPCSNDEAGLMAAEESVGEDPGGLDEVSGDDREGTG
jgi:hypothetical protein